MMRSQVDLVVAAGPEVVLQAVVGASGFIPIVMLAVQYDPVERGYVASFSRPGGNITGVSYRQLELAQKQLELLAEAFPGRTRLAVLWDAGSADQFNAAEVTAKSLPLELRSLKLEKPPYDFDAAFQTLAQDAAQMVLVLSTPFFSVQRARIVELATKHRLPTMFVFKPYVEAGGLMSYGVDQIPMYRRAADYVAKIFRGVKITDLPAGGTSRDARNLSFARVRRHWGIESYAPSQTDAYHLAGGYAARLLKGEKPTDLPIQQAVKFEVIINLKTARALGLEVPPTLLARADEVIE
jgi:putative ABC transport system substrate-binding protein